MTNYQTTYIDRAPVQQEIMVASPREILKTRILLDGASTMQIGGFLTSACAAAFIHLEALPITGGVFLAGWVLSSVIRNRFRNSIKGWMKKGQTELSKASVNGFNFNDEIVPVITNAMIGKVLSSKNSEVRIGLARQDRPEIKLLHTKSGVEIVSIEQTSPLEMWDDALNKIMTPEEEAAMREHFENRIETTKGNAGRVKDHVFEYEEIDDYHEYKSILDNQTMQVAKVQHQEDMIDALQLQIHTLSKEVQFEQERNNKIKYLDDNSLKKELEQKIHVKKAQIANLKERIFKERIYEFDNNSYGSEFYESE